MKDNQNKRFIKPVIAGFIAGFLATLTFHQIVLWVLWEIRIAPFAPYNMAATHPWGIPAVISLALWGGVWGVLFAFIQQYSSRGRWNWIEAFFFGAVFPSLVALLIVLPLKGLPVGGGWHWPLLLTAFLINGAWGVGTAFYLKPFLKKIEPAGHLAHPSECGAGMTC